MMRRSRGLCTWLGARSKSTAINLEVTQQGVAMLRLNCPGEAQNTLSMELIQDFDTAMTRIEEDDAIKAAVLISAKPGSWIAGANIKMLENLESGEAAEEVAGIGQKGMDRVAMMQKKKPWVAAIDGACLGGGLEMALACSYRVATASPKTVLGLPEVMLGLLPGSGGTQRLIPLVGGQAGLDLMLTGKQLKSDRAKKMGLVDHVVDANALERTAVATAMDAVSGAIKPRKRKAGWMDWFLESTGVGRGVLFNQAAKGVAKQTKGKYPAPVAILECAKTGLEAGHTKGSHVERQKFGELAATSESSALRGLFFGQTASKKNRFGAPSVPIETIGVLGAGLMGAGIAEVSAVKDYRVLLNDQNMAGLSRGEAQITKNLDAKLKKRRLTKYKRDAFLASVVGLTEASASWPAHFGKADLVIEAVFEDLAVKHQVIKSMEAVVPEHCIIASNTSTLPIGDIAQAAARPQNVVGMHYFSPVDKMPLLEIIPHKGTATEVIAAAVDVGIKQGKTVVVVGDVPGFYVNRCLGPTIAETVALVQQGADPLVLNKALTDFGYPVGSVTLADEVGIDVAAKVVKNLEGEQPKFLGVRMEGGDLGMLHEFVEQGHLGRKAKKGFLDYSSKEKAKPIHPNALAILQKYRAEASKDASKLPAAELVDRFVLRFVSEAVHCLQDGVIASPRDGDIGAVFGVGFPPFLGGPFMYIDTIGAATVADKMKKLEQEHGGQFTPPQMLLDYVSGGKKFHSA
jgi:enoyl-CoA hydratase/long-chain 3-hydroxyacyl-CoA dehydrogenase